MSREQGRDPPWGIRYGFALAVAGLAVLVRWLATPLIGSGIPLVTLFGAVAWAVWFGGAGPGIAAATVGYFVCTYLFLDPPGQLGIGSPSRWTGLGLFLISSACIVAFGASMRRSRRRADESRKRMELEIQERRRVEEALRNSREQLRIVTDSMSAPVARCSRDLRYLWVSRPYASWLRLVPERIVGRPIREILGESAFERLHPHFDRVLSGEVVRYEERAEFQGIGERWIQAIYTPTRDAKGAVDGWVAVVLDIHDRIQAEESLKIADRRKDEFLATLAHELRNPLAPISNAVQVLRLKDPLSAELRAARDIIDRQVRQMTRLVDDLLDISRITRGGLRLRKERTELEPVLRGAIETVQPLVEARGHQFRVVLPADPVHLEADPTRVGQIISNLLHNAANYTDPGGRISVLVERGGGEVSIAVRDSGVGITAEQLPGIFEMFSQVSPAIDRSAGGLGIGLALVHGLVDLHGGRVEARSDGPGKGSEFIVRLPILPGSPSDGKAAADAAGSVQVSPARRVLIVDDSEDNAESLAMMLRPGGHEIRTASDGAEALVLARAFRPDVVLLDVGMPVLNGFETARRIRGETWGRDIVLVALTGWGQDDDKRRAFGAGFDHHLTKPASPTAIAAILAEASSAPRGPAAAGSPPAT